LLSEFNLNEIKSLGWVELDKIGEIARKERLAFHIAYKKWKTKDTGLRNWFSG
jgi:hypothetical protein